MNTSDTNNTNQDDRQPARQRPLGFWLKVTEHALSSEFESAFANAGITRRDWRMLNALAMNAAAGSPDEANVGSPDATAAGSPDATVADRPEAPSGERPGRAARMAERIAERIARKPHSVHTLADLGWIAEHDGTWIVTEKGKAARAELAETVDAIRSRITGAVSSEDLATTVASLEAIAREFGWDESRPGPRPGGLAPFGRGEHRGFRGFGRGENHGAHRPEFGPNLHHGFGPGRGGAPADAARPGVGDDTEPGGRCNPGHRGSHHERGAHRRHEAERAFERGFEAGFTRGTQSAA